MKSNHSGSFFAAIFFPNTLTFSFFLTLSLSSLPHPLCVDIHFLPDCFSLLFCLWYYPPESLFPPSASNIFRYELSLLLLFIFKTVYLHAFLFHISRETFQWFPCNNNLAFYRRREKTRVKCSCNAFHRQASVKTESPTKKVELLARVRDDGEKEQQQWQWRRAQKKQSDSIEIECLLCESRMHLFVSRAFSIPHTFTCGALLSSKNIRWNVWFLVRL